MNDDDRLDLSALDPLREPDRWRAVLETTRMRTEAVVAARAGDPFWTIAAWSRPILVAVSVAIALLVPVEIVLEAREPRVEQVERLVELSSELDERGPPSAEEFVRALSEAGR